MKTYIKLSAVLLAVLLAMVVIVEGLGVRMLTDPSPWLEEGLPFILLQTFAGAGAAATGNIALVAELALLLAMVFWWVGRLWRRGQLKAG